MELLELMKHRRSIRKYQDRQISKADLETIIEAGTYAPNAGGGQRSMIVGLHNAALAGKIGRMNVARFDRSKLSGSYVSQEQPSIIDDPSTKSGFYGAPTVCIVFAQKNFLYSIPDAFCCAENMVLMATELGISSASWHGERKPLTVKWGQHCSGNGTYPKTISPTVLCYWVM